jgi:hypothetical protein
MKNKTWINVYIGLTIAALLLATAWGNALAMLAISVLGIAVGLLLFRRSLTWQKAAAAAVAFLVAATVALLLRQ